MVKVSHKRQAEVGNSDHASVIAIPCLAYQGSQEVITTLAKKDAFILAPDKYLVWWEKNSAISWISDNYSEAGWFFGY